MHGDARGAADLYQRIVTADRNDVDALAGLIRSLALVEPAQAEQYEAAMPEVTPAADVDTIERETVLRTFRSARAVAGSTDVLAAAPQRAKPKRKRKPRMPKNYVPGALVDPERWLPLWQRSSYRKTKKGRISRDKEMSKGVSQGAAPAGPDPAKEAAPTTPTKPQAPASGSGASSSGGSHRNAKKNKGKSKW